MARPEPEITQIAAVLAEHLPTEGVPHDDAKLAWRGALRYARATGVIDELAVQITAENPELVGVCAKLVQVG